MSNTPKFALRKPYSIREELAALNPFVRREQTGAMQPYTMADIEAAEKRLNFQLPAPIRDLYLTMGDYLCLQNEFYFRALELLLEGTRVTNHLWRYLYRSCQKEWLLK